MLSLLPLIPSAFADTTTVSLDSAEVTDTVDAGITVGCGSAQPLEATATVSVTLTADAVVDLRDFSLQVRGRHAGCEVTLDDATLALDGAEIWTQSIGTSGSGASSADWYLSYTYTTADLEAQILTAGTHTLTLTVTGSGETELLATNQAIGARVQLQMEYGADWDSDGYSDDALSTGTDCDDDDPAIHPDATDGANGVDDDCDGLIDEDVVIDPDDTGGDTGEDTGVDTGGGSGSPDTGDTASADDTGSPDTDDTASADDTGSPDTGDTASADDTGSPDVEDTASASDTGSPDVEDTASVGDTGLPNVEDSASASDTGSPDAEDTASAEDSADSSAWTTGGRLSGGACATARPGPGAAWPLLLTLAAAWRRARRA